MTSDKSVTHWLEELKDGHRSVAQQALWNRYFDRLVAMARIKLDGSPRRAEDEEDVALSALDSFFQAAQVGRYADLQDRTQLWHLLVRITASKSINQIKRQKAHKRGSGKVVGESALEKDPAVHRRRALEQIVGEQPTPEFAALVSEQCRLLLDKLDGDLAEVARMRLEGYSNAEIAEQLDVVERTVERKLGLIRKCWSRELDESELP